MKPWQQSVFIWYKILTKKLLLVSKIFKISSKEIFGSLAIPFLTLWTFIYQGVPNNYKQVKWSKLFKCSMVKSLLENTRAIVSGPIGRTNVKIRNVKQKNDQNICQKNTLIYLKKKIHMTKMRNRTFNCYLYVTFQIRLITEFVETWGTQRVGKDLLTLPVHLYSVVCLFFNNLFIFSHGVVSLFSSYEFKYPYNHPRILYGSFCSVFRFLCCFVYCSGICLFCFSTCFDL